jgi:hypothetical protein
MPRRTRCPDVRRRAAIDRGVAGERHGRNPGADEMARVVALAMALAGSVLYAVLIHGCRRNRELGRVQSRRPRDRRPTVAS